MTISNADLLTFARELPIPVPWKRDVFIANLAQVRGRPIKLIPTDTAELTESPCGLWLACADEDLILHETGTSDYHIDQIVCHELGHMLLDHGRGANPGLITAHERKLCEHLLPDIDPASIRAILGRTTYADDQERDAEMFANMIMIAAAEADERRSMIRSAFLRRQ